MSETADPLVLDFVEWIAREPLTYSEVIGAWRTSCPGLTIWKMRHHRGYIARQTVAGSGFVVKVPKTARSSCARMAACAVAYRISTRLDCCH